MGRLAPCNVRSWLSAALILVGLTVCMLALTQIAEAALSRHVAAAPAGRVGARMAFRSPSVRNAPAVMLRIPGDAPTRLPHGTRLVALTRAQGRHLTTVSLVLKRTDQRGFEQYLREVYDRHSPSYRHFLSEAQLAARFGPSAALYRRVERWVASKHLRVVQRSANRLSLTARGSLSGVSRAFATPIRAVGRGHGLAYVNAEAPAVPSWLHPHAQAVTGLSSLAQPTAAPDNQWLCNHGYGVSAGGKKAVALSCDNLCTKGPVGPMIQPYGFLGALAAVFAKVGYLLLALPGKTLGTGFTLVVDPNQLAYCFGTGLANSAPGFGNWVAGNWGASSNVARRSAGHVAGPASLPRSRRVAHAAPGSIPPQKVGLLEFDTYRPSDVQDWSNLLQLDPSIVPRLSKVDVNGGVASPGAGESEVLLDIDAVLGATSLAPSTSVVVYDAPPSTSFVQMFQAMLAGGDTVISNSWSQCEDQTPIADAQAIDSVLASAAAAGVTVVNGAGDNGSTCLDGSPNTVGVPADSPHATAVGGTTPTYGPGLSYQSETWWDGRAGDPASGAGGYGVSRYFARPSYQNGLDSSPMRSVPDLSFVADPEGGMELCQADDGGCPDGKMFGGTSMAAPGVAGLVADLNEGLGRDVGDLNGAVYPLARTDAFHSPASLGSDFAHVGLGSPDFTAIAHALGPESTGATSTSESNAVALGQPQANGSDQGAVRVDLADANGFPEAGKKVTLTPDAASHATVSPSQATTDANGTAEFTVTDTSAEQVTFTTKDQTDGVTLSQQPTLSFSAPVASGAEIYGSPSNVTDDGSDAATVTVYLEDSLSRPAPGKTVTLSQGGGNAVITPEGSSTPGNTAVTDAAGNATFTVTDTQIEAVDLTAVDTTDGNLPVPGSVLVNFSSAGASCPTALPTAGSGFSVSAFASSFPYTTEAITYPGNFTVHACTSFESAPAFDSSGNAYIPDTASGTIYVLGPSGGTATTSDELPDANFPGGSLGQLVFDKSGNLYAGLIQSSGSVSDPEIVQLDPQTGATLRVIADSAMGLPDCPFVLAADPLSGDLFTDDECSGYAASNQISRIEDPSGSSPTVSDYLTTSGCNVGMSFAPDGTLYLANCNGEVDSIGGTNTADPTTTKVGDASGAFAVAVTSSDPAGHATALQAFIDTGGDTSFDLTSDPVTTSPAATGSSGFFLTAVGHGGCGYGSIPGTVVGVCPSGASAGPEITLGESSGSATPPTGAMVGFTASLENVAAPSGIPIHFAVSGPNQGISLMDASGSGQASYSYAGVYQGVDTVTAWAVVNGTAIISAPVAVHWTAGKDTSFLDLNQSQQGGPLGHGAPLTATLLDVTQSPVAPIADVPVTLSLGGQSCVATTSSSGVASCSVTPASTTGLEAITATYAGDASHTPAKASNAYALGGIGLGAAPAPPPPGAPVNSVKPAISGRALPGDALTCSTGTWSGSPTSYGYQWYRGGKPISGATKSKYTVQIADEAQLLSCVVTASNSAGVGAGARSGSLLVALAGTTKCVKPSGRLSGGSVGRLRLGMSKKAARKKLRRFGVTHNDFDNFCLYGGWGIRAGYVSSKLLKSLPVAERRRVSGIVLLLTANPFYAFDGTRPGAGLTRKLERRLRLGKRFKVGSNVWYIAPGKGADGVLKVRGGVIQEVGVGNRRLLGSRAAQRRFLTSFSNT